MSNIIVGETMTEFKKCVKWLKSGKYLPSIMRDFHDQKKIFKHMHLIYRDNKSLTVNWIDGHIYVIDCFLWYMASRGYTLQKSKKKIKFRDFSVNESGFTSRD